MKTPTHIYISGPMRGRDGFNFPAFFEAERLVRERFPEADINNPAREDCVAFGLTSLLDQDPTGLLAGRWLVDHPEAFDHRALRDALGNDLAYITQHADLLIMLPGWEGSKGALCEAATAAALGVPVVLSDMTPAVEEWALAHAPAANSEAATPSGEVRTTSASGGQKGVKLADFSQIPPEAMILLAEHFGKGARKYSAHNFRKGYEWSKNYSAMMRHMLAFWAGEDFDEHSESCPEDCLEHTGSLHTVAAAWHAMVLTQFYIDHKEYDDRYVAEDHH